MKTVHKSISLRWFRYTGCYLITLLSLTLTACQSLPTEQAFAKAYGANLQYIQGAPYVHAVYVNPAAFRIQTDQGTGNYLHVYIEGDANAFVNGKVSVNPTPDNPLMLALMQKDEQPAIYLGRPCYFNPEDHQCSPDVWTRQRYSKAVVHSMAAALKTFSHAYEGVVLMGHSGGGALAVLLAEKEPKTRMVVTLAGNLDTFSWALEHNYQPLKQSLNPLEQPPLPTRIIQIHYAGADDRVIDADWVQAYAEKQHRAEFQRLLAVSHTEGWQEFWPQVLDKLQRYQQFAAPGPIP
ncbi:MAG: dienelactone hydrolase family protein [Ketobacteraceae bacterium]|nr:dienelactone hydrolase family protein [Ketobacteraceae bacterium]